MEEYYEVRDMFVPFNLPISIDDIDVEAVYDSVLHDKKRKGDLIHFVLLQKIGKAFVCDEVTGDEMKAGISEIYFSDEDMKE